MAAETLTKDSPATATRSGVLVGLRKDLDWTLERALNYLETASNASWDPNDIFGSAAFQWIQAKQSIPRKMVSRLLRVADILAPKISRRLLGVKPRATAGGLAFKAMLFTEAASHFTSPRYNEIAKETLALLEKEGTNTSQYIGWGFPFLWHSLAVVPAGTPIGHTTMCCGNAFYTFFLRNRDEWSRGVLERVANFFLVGLNRSERPSGSIALSYTALDQSQVINTNADIGSLLLRAGSTLENASFSEAGLKLIEFTLETQNRDGSWYYFAEDSIGKPSFIDGYHTGMVLSALVQSYPYVPPDTQERLVQVVKRGLKYYLSVLFTKEGVPKFLNQSVYPIDVYSYAQALITLSDCLECDWVGEELRRETWGILGRVARQFQDTMTLPNGAFLYRRYRFKKVDLNSLRWANALATLSLLRVSKLLSETGR